MSDIRVGLIGGSGLGDLLQNAQQDGQRHAVDTPFGPPSDAIVQIQLEGLEVFVLARHGPGHLLNPTQVPYRANIFALKQLGVTHIIASGAVGSLREECRPRDLVIADQIIDKTSQRPEPSLIARPSMSSWRNLFARCCVKSCWKPPRTPRAITRFTTAAATSAWKAPRFQPVPKA